MSVPLAVETGVVAVGEAFAYRVNNWFMATALYAAKAEMPDIGVL